ncbi:MAG: hypothetical protein ACRDOG_14260 [Gaiellaceae bacterium]
MGQADTVPAARGASYALLALALVLLLVAAGCGSDGSGAAGPQEGQAADVEEGEAEAAEEDDGADDEQPSDEQVGDGPVDVLFSKRFECGETFDAATETIEAGASGELLAEARLTRAISGLCAGLDPAVLEADLEFSRENQTLLNPESTELLTVLDQSDLPRGQAEVLDVLAAIGE